MQFLRRWRILASRLLLSQLVAGCGGRWLPPTIAPAAARTDIAATVILIGDAGDPKASGEPVLQALTRVLAERPDTTVVLFLGDNVYPLGLPDSADAGFPEASRRLAAQVAFAKSTPVLFVPGNHDWDKSGKDGLARIRRQGRFIERESGGRARLLPSDGCPGPETVDVSPRLRLVLLDTEWWLFPHEKPGAESSCSSRSPAEVVAALKGILAASAGRQVIVAGHHPLETGGPHGGFFSLRQHLFPLTDVHSALWLPLPIIGSLYPALRGGFGMSSEDIYSGAYGRFRSAMDSAFACTPPAVYAAGHEHAQQVIEHDRAPLLLVSGAGIYGHESYVEAVPGTRVAIRDAGFMRADLLRDGRLRIGVISVDVQGVPREVAAQVLPPASDKEGCGEASP
jgi:hypothetical protein